MTGPVVEYDPSWPDEDQPQRNGHQPDNLPATRQGPTTTAERDDNVFDLEEEAPPIVLNGMSRYGIEQGTVMQEPSQQAMRRFRRAFWEAQRAMRPERDLPEDPTDEQIDEVMASRDWGEAVSAREVDAFALLCGATRPATPRPEAPERPERPKTAKGATEQARKTAETRHQRAVDDWEKAMDAHREKVINWEDQWDGGVPTREQLAGLPYRGQAKLFGYLYAKFLDPFGIAAATNSSAAAPSGDASTASFGSG